MATIEPLIDAIIYSKQQEAIEIINGLTDEQLVIKDTNGWTLLHYAAGNGRNKVVKTLLERLSAEQLVIKNKNGYTPLHYAAYCGYNDVVKTLLERLPKEARFITNNDGKTPLDLAKSDEIKKLLEPMTKSAYC